MTDDQIKQMVSRFLNWKLPENFAPDGGVTFERVGNKGTPYEYTREPTGTNLLDERQAEEMVRHMIEELPPQTSLPPLTFADPLQYPLPSWLDLVEEAVGEAHRAMCRFPQPNYVISKFAEESGEVVKAAIHTAEGRDTAENLRGEMRQAIAMLYRLWMEGDRVHGLAAVHRLVEEGRTV